MNLKTNKILTKNLALIKFLFATGMLLFFVGLAKWSLIQQDKDLHRMPTEATIRKAQRIIQENWQSNDVIRIQPTWFSSGRVGMLGFPALMTDELDPYDLHRYDRIWLAFDPTHADLAAQDRTWLANTQVMYEHSKWRLEVGTINQENVIWNGFDDIENASVSQWHPEQQREQACTLWSHESWHCERYNPWIFVGPRIEDIDDNPRTCITANAPAEQAVWIIQWDNLPRQGELEVRAANTLLGVRGLRGGPILFQIKLDGQIVENHIFEPHDFGFTHFDIEIPNQQDSQNELTLEIRISSPDHMDRFFCFTPQIVF